MQLFSLLLSIAFLCSCQHRLTTPAVTPDTLALPVSDTSILVQDRRLDELSGIASSVVHTGMLYVHNDSGDSSRYFVLGADGLVKSVVYYDGDPALKPLQVRDVEDIAVCTDPVKGASYVYMGDIGDNNAVRKYIRIYRIKEPAAFTPVMHLGSEALTLQYPDGPRDAETLMADPVDKMLYIVSKREDSVAVYSTPLSFTAGDTVVLTRRARLFFAGSGQSKWITAGDIAHSGSQVLLKSYSQVFYWKRSAGVSIWKTLQEKPAILPYIIEPQGEAIGFSADDKGYYTTSEGTRPRLYYYRLAK